LTAVAATAAAQPWKPVGAQGARQFAVVDKAVAADETTLKQAASSMCKPGKACVVMFWTDEKLVPAKLPLTKPQSDAVVAQYTRNPSTGHEALLLKCQGGEEKGKRCLK
jgi:hypothetical protein